MENHSNDLDGSFQIWGGAKGCFHHISRAAPEPYSNGIRSVCQRSHLPPIQMVLTRASTRLLVRTIRTIFYVSIVALVLDYFQIIHISSSESSPIVDLGYASYKGNQTSPRTTVYLGIPYAEPPLGNLRFRSPVPLDTSRIARKHRRSVIDARSYPEPCIQGATNAGELGGAGTEDCLKLNIYVPSGVQKGDELPVIVYIHGGGFVNGNPSSWSFEHWIDQAPHAVIVSIYYRLGAFGFLAHSAFSNRTLGDQNVGIRDQIEALRWVQKYIGRFGGDPGRVTLSGQSAGATSVLHHIVHQRNSNLFHAAIIQSLFRAPMPTPSQQEALFEAFVEELGCGTGTTYDQLACLRTSSAAALARAQDATFLGRLSGHYHVFAPVQDRKTLPEPSTIAITNGRFMSVPLIVGSTSNETYCHGSSIDAALKSFYPQMHDSDIRDLLEKYPQSAFASYEHRFRSVTGDSSFRSVLATAFSKKPNHRVWTYRFNQPDPTSGKALVEHSADNFMMFRGVKTGPNGTATFNSVASSTSEFASEMISYWMSFVRSGDPNTHKSHRSPHWPEYSTGSQGSKVRMVLQEGGVGESGSYVEVEDAEESVRCDFVASIANVQQT
ncbi:hypothetical protein NLI96_g6703 [Meripilus lineatus]|uniref:Carboxylic ester hydrolase n=1 Tax=Meripilus lineatus TaxID=2056292 RepID=A0AAD5YCQ5_9APHY|nr:hypothetical protein NLI96_g6703 [Physisporinus lineatus]